MEVDDAEDLNEVVVNLEKQEIENGGTLSSSEYTKLMAALLYQNDLISATFLWKRIPDSMETSELEALWRVCKALKQKNFTQLHTALKFSWSPEMTSFMVRVSDAIQKNLIKLVGKVYSCLTVDQLCTLIGLKADEAVKLATVHGWRIDGSRVYPLRPPPDFSPAECLVDNTEIEKLSQCIVYFDC